MKFILPIILIICALIILKILWKPIIEAVRERNWLNSLQQGSRVYHKPTKKVYTAAAKPILGRVILLDEGLIPKKVSTTEIAPPWEYLLEFKS